MIGERHRRRLTNRHGRDVGLGELRFDRERVDPAQDDEARATGRRGLPDRAGDRQDTAGARRDYRRPGELGLGLFERELGIVDRLLGPQEGVRTRTSIRTTRGPRSAGSGATTPGAAAAIRRRGRGCWPSGLSWLRRRACGWPRRRARRRRRVGRGRRQDEVRARDASGLTWRGRFGCLLLGEREVGVWRRAPIVPRTPPTARRWIESR